MEDAKIQKPRRDTLFRSTESEKLVSNLRFEFNIDFIRRGASLCILKDNFLNAKSQQL